MNKKMSLNEYLEIQQEISQQAMWRSVADKEADYADGNQLDSALLNQMQRLGIPPAVEDLISPTILSVQGYEANIRTDWRLTSDDGETGQEVADALNFKLNQAERKSLADRACSDAFRSQIVTGIGWVEVAREQNPFKFPYRCSVVHRNEIYWDMTARELDLSDARFLLRQKWLHIDKVKGVFPNFDYDMSLLGGSANEDWDGGNSTGLNNSWGERFPTLKEDAFYNRENKMVCINELWYRRYGEIVCLKSATGKVVEYNPNSENHKLLIANNLVQVFKASVPKMRRAYWIGNQCLIDTETPYPHDNFPYVPFWGFREDMTNIPYGLVRGMRYAQDALNSVNAKLRWGLAVVRTERTKGVVDMTDAQFREQIARPNADIVLNADELARAGSRFSVIRDYQLSQQHYQMLQDNRSAIERVSGINQSFKGGGNATSGYQEQQRIEQSNQSLARLIDNFRVARTQVGELLLAMLIDEMGDREQEITIPPSSVTQSRTIALNVPMVENSISYLKNDIQKTRLKVALEEVPQSQSFRSQQLNALSETVKSLPAEYQTAALPYMINLMDMPYKERIIEELNKVKEEQAQQQSPEIEMRERELQIKEKIADARIKALDAQAVQIGVNSAYAAMQSGATIAQMPQVAPIADEVMKSAGYTAPNPVGDDPNYPQPENVPVPDETIEQQNTNPTYPPTVRRGGLGLMRGIRTRSFGDNTRF